MIYLDPKGLWLLSFSFFCQDRQEAREISGWDGQKECDIGVVKAASFWTLFINMLLDLRRNQLIQGKREDGMEGKPE